ncbi:hypothetical protein M0804_015127 [Polistes exclamans]|nr:hypothetical protein M0804_015127 [Polistes exclamans]
MAIPFLIPAAEEDQQEFSSQQLQTILALYSALDRYLRTRTNTTPTCELILEYIVILFLTTDISTIMEIIRVINEEFNDLLIKTIKKILMRITKN